MRTVIKNDAGEKVCPRLGLQFAQAFEVLYLHGGCGLDFDTDELALGVLQHKVHFYLVFVTVVREVPGFVAERQGFAQLGVHPGL